MRIVTRREPKDPLYRFECGYCESTLECELRELEPVGFKSTGGFYTTPCFYNYICPVCGHSEVIGEQFLRKVER